MEGKIQMGRKGAAEVGNGILTAYFLVMMAVYPFYIQDGYWEIGNVKYYFFRNVSLVMMGSMMLVALVGMFFRREKNSVVKFYETMSATDWFVYGYLLCNLVSYFFSPYRSKALWGAEGWYMGLVSQLVFIGIYFFYSRYFKWNEKLLCLTLLASGLAFLLGVLNRYSIYPIEMGGQTPTFISTLGNINWFCGYWAVICPLGILFYRNAEDGWKQAAAGVYVVIAFLSGVTQGSGSAYLALAGIFLFLFALSFDDNHEMRRLLEIGILFAVSCQLARVLRYLPGWKMNYEKDFGTVLTDTNLTLYIGIVLGAVYVVFCIFTKRKGFQIAEHKWIRLAVLLPVCVLLLGYPALLIGNTCLPGGIPGLFGVSVFTFRDAWANYRGATWTDGFLAFLSLPFLHKIVGVGPDCFAEYAYAVPGLAERIYGQFGSSRLTNAHNEWLTVLVNQGIAGAFCYVGIFVSAFLRYVKSGRARPVLYLFAAVVFVYTIHNIVSFQQVLNTPYAFLLLGSGEAVRRAEKK